MDLTQTLRNLPSIPSGAVQAYRENMGRMVEMVNRIMSQRADIQMLTGGNPMSMVFDNHKNHGLFMRCVFSLGRFDMLAHTIPWVYRTYQQHGFSYSYFPAHLQAWQQAIQAFLAPEEAAPLLAVYQWIESHHETFIALSQQPPEKPEKPDENWKEIYDRFLASLIDGDRQTGMAIAKQSVSSLSGLNDFYVEVIQSAMYKIGALWEKGEISVAREHLASALVNRIMAMQYIELMQPGETLVGTAVVTAATNEFHEIGATMVANSLEADGWKVEYLGANTPLTSLIDFVSNTKPDILAISSSMPYNLESILEIIQEIKSWPAENQPRIMAGGLAFQNLPDLVREVGADGYAKDCREAVVLARTWQKEIAG